MTLQDKIIGLLSLQSMTLDQIVQEVKKANQNQSVDTIAQIVRRMRGVTICAQYSRKVNGFVYTLMKPQTPSKSELNRSATIPASQCEVVAKKVLDGAKIEEVAAMFSCKPLTVIRKVQQYCMEQDSELYNSLISGNRKTASVQDLVQAFTANH